MNSRICMLTALTATGLMLGTTMPAPAQTAPDRSVAIQQVQVRGKAMQAKMQYLRGVEPLTLTPANKRTVVAQRAAAKALLRRE